jgi:hypothetical protein
MKLDLITRIVDGIAGVRKDGGAHLVPEDVDLSIYVIVGHEVLTVSRVSRLAAAAELLTIETFKGDRFFFALEDVAGFKTGPSEGKPGRGAGFR